MSNSNRLAVSPEQVVYSFDPAATTHLLETETGLHMLAATSPDIAWPAEVTEVPTEVTDRADLLRRSPAARSRYLGDVVWQAYFEHAQRLESELSTRSHDEQFEPDTGLYKKAYWTAEVQRFVNHVSQHGGSGAILQFDVDAMKQANDHGKLGHARVDEVIARLLERLGAHARPNFKASRTGGDELSVLVSFLPEDNITFGDNIDLREERRGREQMTDEQRSEALMHRILAEFEEEFEKPMMIDGKLQPPRKFVKAFGASGGYGVLRQGITGIDAIRAADAMVYEQKEEKRQQRFNALSERAQGFITRTLAEAEEFKDEFELDPRMFRF